MLCIGGSRGRAGTRPPTGPNSFIFAHIFTEKCPHWRPKPPPKMGLHPLWEILDPALVVWSEKLLAPLVEYIKPLADLVGMPGAHTPYGTKFFHFRIHFQWKVPTSEVHAPYWTQFFDFCIHFWWKAPASEVHAPLTGPRPPYGKSWIRHWKQCLYFWK